MTAEEMKADGAPLEGVDITPKQDEGVLKVPGSYSPSPPSALARRGPCGGGKSGGFPLGLRAGAPQAPWAHRVHCVLRGEGDEAVPGHPGRAGAARAIKQQRRRAGARPGCASAARPCAGALRSSWLPPLRPGPAGAWAARGESSGSRGGCTGKRRFSLRSGFPPWFKGRCGRGRQAGLCVRPATRVVGVRIHPRAPSTCPGPGIKDGAPAGHVRSVPVSAVPCCVSP